jgi:hypothetical protein
MSTLSDSFADKGFGKIVVGAAADRFCALKRNLCGKRENLSETANGSKLSMSSLSGKECAEVTLLPHCSQEV